MWFSERLADSLLLLLLLRLLCRFPLVLEYISDCKTINFDHSVISFNPNTYWTLESNYLFIFFGFGFIINIIGIIRCFDASKPWTGVTWFFPLIRMSHLFKGRKLYSIDMIWWIICWNIINETLPDVREYLHLHLIHRQMKQLPGAAVVL